MTFDELFIRTKIKMLKGYVKELADFLRYTDEEIFKSSEKIHIGEREFQLAVDAMLDINQHIIEERNLKVFEDLRGTFITLGKNSILPENFASRVADIVGVRNRIVHGYESLDKKLFMINLRKNYSDFEQYIKFIVEFLEK